MLKYESYLLGGFGGAALGGFNPPVWVRGPIKSFLTAKSFQRALTAQPHMSSSLSLITPPLGSVDDGDLCAFTFK